MPAAVQPVGGLRRQQQVVDADAVVLLPGAGLIIPERVEARVVADRANRIGQPEIAEARKLRAGLRQEQRVVDPGSGIVGVGRGRDDVVVAGEDERLLQRQMLAA